MPQKCAGDPVAAADPPPSHNIAIVVKAQRVCPVGELYQLAVCAPDEGLGDQAPRRNLSGDAALVINRPWSEVRERVNRLESGKGLSVGAADVAVASSSIFVGPDYLAQIVDSIDGRRSGKRSRDIDRGVCDTVGAADEIVNGAACIRVGSHDLAGIVHPRDVGKSRARRIEGEGRVGLRLREGNPRSQYEDEAGGVHTSFRGNLRARTLLL